MMKRLLTVAIATIILATAASGQTSELDRSRLNQAAYYNYTEPGDVAIRIHVWGAVRYPGLYEIPRGSRLNELMSLAGGPLFGERSKRSERVVNLRLHRRQEDQRSVVFSTRMKNEIVVRGDDPVIMDGDILTMEAVTRQGFRWRDIFPVVSMVATIVLLIDRVRPE